MPPTLDPDSCDVVVSNSLGNTRYRVADPFSIRAVESKRLPSHYGSMREDSKLTMVTGTQPNGWTDERVELLKKLWMEGLSASQIAGELGEGVTRNAVIGKVHRLKLSSRGRAP